MDNVNSLFTDLLYTHKYRIGYLSKPTFTRNDSYFTPLKKSYQFKHSFYIDAKRRKVKKVSKYTIYQLCGRAIQMHVIL